MEHVQLHFVTTHAFWLILYSKLNLSTIKELLIVHTCQGTVGLIDLQEYGDCLGIWVLIRMPLQ